MLRSCLASVLLLLQSPGAAAWEKSKGQLNGMSFNKLRKIPVPALDMEKIEAEDAANPTKNGPVRFSVMEELDLSLDDGEWTEVTDGGLRSSASTKIMQFAFTASDENCKSLNFEFSQFYMPGETKLFIFDPNKEGLSIGRPLSSVHNTRDNRQWSPVFPSCDVVMELDIPDTVNSDDVKLHIDGVFIGYREFGVDGSQRARGLQGSCNVDVACSNGAPPGTTIGDWQDEIDSVVVIGANAPTGGTFCSAAMINNVREDYAPLMLTAAHCSVNPASVSAYFNYQRDGCGTGSGNLQQYILGAELRAQNSNSDATLVEFFEQPDPAWGYALAGFNAEGGETDSEYMVAIHHPSTGYKKISYEEDMEGITITSYSSSGGGNTHIRINDWDSGTTEPGSSGSPLFNDQHQIVGQLHGGTAACGNNDPDWYGRLFKSWDDQTDFQRALDPDNTGVKSIGPLRGADPCEFVEVEVCGDSCRFGSEVCDGSDTGGLTCQSPGYGFMSGTLGCTSSCTIDSYDCDKERVGMGETFSGSAAQVQQKTIAPQGDFNRVTISMAGATSGDADLYVSRNGPPARGGPFECRSWNSGTADELCVVNSSPGQVIYYMIDGWTDFTDAVVTIATNGNAETSTSSPTVSPTPEPTPNPTEPEETPSPTKNPTKSPTNNPTKQPTSSPTPAPTPNPTDSEETPSPTKSPTNNPTKQPTTSPTPEPTPNPTEPEETPSPTKSPTRSPTNDPTLEPTPQPVAVGSWEAATDENTFDDDWGDWIGANNEWSIRRGRSDLQCPQGAGGRCARLRGDNADSEMHTRTLSAADNQDIRIRFDYYQWNLDNGIDSMNVRIRFNGVNGDWTTLETVNTFTQNSCGEFDSIFTMDDFNSGGNSIETVEVQIQMDADEDVGLEYICVNDAQIWLRSSASGPVGTPAPSVVPTSSPTASPSESPTLSPSVAPTDAPTPNPTDTLATNSPTNSPTTPSPTTPSPTTPSPTTPSPTTDSPTPADPPPPPYTWDDEFTNKNFGNWVDEDGPENVPQNIGLDTFIAGSASFVCEDCERFSVRLRGGGLLPSDPIDVDGYSTVEVTIWYRIVDMDNGGTDGFRLSSSFGGSAYNNPSNRVWSEESDWPHDSSDNGSDFQEVVEIDVSSSGESVMFLQFENYSNNPNDKVFIARVVVAVS